MRNSHMYEETESMMNIRFFAEQAIARMYPCNIRLLNLKRKGHSVHNDKGAETEYFFSFDSHVIRQVFEKNDTTEKYCGYATVEVYCIKKTVPNTEKEVFSVQKIIATVEEDNSRVKSTFTPGRNGFPLRNSGWVVKFVQ